MKTGTPEQIRLFHRRRLMANVGMAGIFLLSFLLSLISLRHSLALSAGAIILIWPGVTAWKSACIRCPICGQPISRRGGGPGREPTFGTVCEKCHVDFAG